MQLLRAVFSGLVALGLVAACSSGGSGGATDASSFASQYCQVFSPCCAKKGYPSDGTTCTNFVDQSAAGRTYDPAAGDQCLTEARTAAQAPDFCDNGESPASCKQVFKSASSGAQPGQPCKQASDCASSPEGEVDCHLESTSGAETRTCQVQIRGKENDTPCSGTRDGNVTSYSYSSSSTDPTTPPRVYVCWVSDGLYCDGNTKKCTRMQDVGGPCTGTGEYECVKTAYCDYSQKKCVDRLPAGADCGQTFASQACQDKLYCDSTTKKCTQAFAAGTACQKSEQCESHSCVNGKCDDSNGLADLGYLLLCGPKPGGG